MKSTKIFSIQMHTYTVLPDAPPKDFPTDGPPPPRDSFKRHEGAGDPAADGVEITQTKKMMRCNHISAPLQVYAIVMS